MSGAVLPASLVARLHREADAARWQVSPERLAQAVSDGLARTIGTAPSPSAIEQYVAGLHLADLALACACIDGDEAAWAHLVGELRPVLYRVADLLAPGGAGRELADAVYGDLFGTTVVDGERRSLLRYFHGRSSLATWLRAVLAQRQVDGVRAGRRQEPLPDDESGRAIAQPTAAPDPERSRWVAAVRRGLGAALRALPDRDRLRISLYYAQDLTLAQIGRVTGEHESTVSRHLRRLRRGLREAIEQHLIQQEQLAPGAAIECLTSVIEDAGALDLQELLEPAPTVPSERRKNSAPARSVSGGPGVV